MTRLKILQKLSLNDCYLTELSASLNINNRALLRHLESLSNMGLLESYLEEKARGRPPRKYYRVSKSFQIRTTITPEFFDINIIPIDEPQNIDDLPELPDVSEIFAQFEKARSEGDMRKKFSSLLSLADVVENYLRRITHIEAELTSLLRQILQEIQSSINIKFGNSLASVIMKMLIMNGGRIRLEDLKAQLNIKYDNLIESIKELHEHNLIKFDGECIYVE